MTEETRIAKTINKLIKEIEELKQINKDLESKISTLEGELEFTRNKVQVGVGRGCY
jgi:predicted RNase H-like nuclease (RuvC/YqgF family)